MTKELKQKAKELEELRDLLEVMVEQKKELSQEVFEMMVNEGVDKVGRCYFGWKANSIIYSDKCQVKVDKLKGDVKKLNAQMTELKKQDKEDGTILKESERMIFIKKKK
jgi:hypothetical protein